MPRRRSRSSPSCRARRLHRALALLALELGVVAALRAVDPAAEQRDRKICALDRVSCIRIASVGDSSRLTSLRKVSSDTFTDGVRLPPVRPARATRIGWPSRTSMSHERSPIA